jgi:lysozyme
VVNLLFADIVLPKDRALALLDIDLKDAAQDAEQFFPGLEGLSENRQFVLIDMSFNMGLSSLLKFRNFRSALLSEDYSRAADEMKDSRWYKQVGVRSRFLVDLMRDDTW